MPGTGAAIAVGRREPGRALSGWRLLAMAGFALVPIGAIFVLRFWDPTPGPYVANETYPYGGHLNAWAVAFGFSWMAFGLLFGSVAAAGARAPTERAWRWLLTTWSICWFPHAFIVLAVLVGGMDRRSVHSYREWAADPIGTVVLGIDALLLLFHLGGSVAGFVWARRELTRLMVDA